MKGQGLISMAVRFKAEPGLGEKPFDQRGPALDALEPVPDNGDHSVSVTALQVYRLVTDKSNRPPTAGPRASLPLR